MDEVPDERSIRISRTQEYLPVYEGALQRDFKEFTTPEDPLHVGEPLSQEKSSCRCAGVVYLPSPFLGAPEEIRELSSPFSRSCDKNGLSLSQNNANALFCLASLRPAEAGDYTCHPYLIPSPEVGNQPITKEQILTEKRLTWLSTGD